MSSYLASVPSSSPDLIRAYSEQKDTHVKIQIVKLDSIGVLAGDVDGNLDHLSRVLVRGYLDRVFLDHLSDDLGVFPEYQKKQSKSAG